MKLIHQEFVSFHEIFTIDKKLSEIVHAHSTDGKIAVVHQVIVTSENNYCAIVNIYER